MREALKVKETCLLYASVNGMAIADERCSFVWESLTESFLGGHHEWNSEFEWKKGCQER